MPNVHFSFEFDTLFVIIAFNVIGTGLQYLLNCIHEKKKWVWSDRALAVVNFLMSMIAILVANRRHPITGPEAPEKK